jgi:hypothetical protein
VVHGERGIRQLYVDLGLAFAKENGHPLTPELVAQLQREALEREAEELAKVRSRGIAGNLRKLLAAKRKADAKRWAASMVLEQRDFTDLIQNSGAIGLSHHERFQEFLPEGRELTPAEATVLFANRGEGTPESVTRRVRQILVEREYRASHLFADSRDRWHLFIMTFVDLAGDALTGAHHWKHGPHVHYLSYLFNPSLTKMTVWRALDGRRHSLPSMHIRLRPLEPRRDDGSRLILDERERRFGIVKLPDDENDLGHDHQ